MQISLGKAKIAKILFFQRSKEGKSIKKSGWVMGCTGWGQEVSCSRKTSPPPK